MNSQSLVRLTLQICLTAFFSVFIVGTKIFAQTTDNQPKPRDIVPVFESVRPPSEGVGKINASPKPPRPTYSRISSRINSGKIGSGDRPRKCPPRPNQPDIAESKARQIGITLWRLKEVQNKRDLIVLTESSGVGKNRLLMPERVSVDTLFQPYDLVRMTIEASRRGYLYVVDQEMYPDGTQGDAYLVFPNKRIGGGANLIAPGKPVELPDLKGNPFYFELRPETQNGKTLTAEILTVIITDQPIAGLNIGNAPLQINEKTLAGWRTKWAGKVEIFEADGGKTAYTKNEREAVSGGGILNAADPLPQTVFMVEGNKNAGSLLTVPLWYGDR